MLKWPLSITREDMDKITISKTLITNRRWLMEHKTFLALLRPPDRGYWEKLFNSSELPVSSQYEESTGTMIWKFDGAGMGHPMEALWNETRKSKDNEIELKATNICISRNPETTNSYRLQQMMKENGTSKEEQDHLNRFEALFDHNQSEYLNLEAPVRIYITDRLSNSENLNTGLPIGVWPITQVGDLFVTGGRLRDFVRVRRSYDGEDKRLMAVIAPCPCEWVEDIQDICMRQGGVHKDNEVQQAEYFKSLRKLVEISCQMDLPVAPRKNQRTLIL